MTPHSYPLDDRRSPKFATHTDLAKGSLGYNQVIMTVIGCVIHRSCSPVRGPFVRTFSYPHSWHDGVDHQHHSGDSGSPFFLLTDLGKFAKGTADYNACYQCCHWPFLLACSCPHHKDFVISTLGARQFWPPTSFGWQWIIFFPTDRPGEICQGFSGL